MSEVVVIITTHEYDTRSQVLSQQPASGRAHTCRWYEMVVVHTGQMNVTKSTSIESKGLSCLPPSSFQ